MAAPTIAPDTGVQDIEAGVSYQVVLSSFGDTTIGFDPNPQFQITRSSRTLTIKFIGQVVSPPATYTIKTWAANADGTSTRNMRFRVIAPVIGTFPTDFTLDATDGSSTFAFTDGISRVLAGDMLYADPSSGSNLSGLLLVKTKNVDGTFTLVKASTPNAADIVFDGDDTATIKVHMSLSSLTNTRLWVADSSGLSVGTKIGFSANSTWLNAGDAMTGNLAGIRYVTEIVDSRHIRVGKVAGGTAIQPDRTWIPSNPGSDAALNLLAVGGGHIPSVTSDGASIIPTGGGFSYTFAGNLADSFSATGLPSWMTLFPTGISGTAPGTNSSFAILITATHGIYTFKRYWHVQVGTGGVIGGGTTGSGDQGQGTIVTGGSGVSLVTLPLNVDEFGVNISNAYLEQPGTQFSLQRYGFDIGIRHFITRKTNPNKFKVGASDYQYPTMYIAKITEEDLLGGWILVTTEYLGLLQAQEKQPEYTIDADPRDANVTVVSPGFIPVNVSFRVAIATVQKVYITKTLPDMNLIGAPVPAPVNLPNPNMSAWTAFFTAVYGFTFALTITWWVWVLEKRSLRIAGDPTISSGSGPGVLPGFYGDGSSSSPDPTAPNTGVLFEVTDSFRRAIAVNGTTILT